MAAIPLGQEEVAVEVPALRHRGSRSGSGSQNRQSTVIPVDVIEPSSPWASRDETASRQRSQLADVVFDHDQGTTDDDIAVVGVDSHVLDAKSGIDRQLHRVDSRGHIYTPIAPRSPITWRNNNPELLFKDVAVLVVVTMYNESASDLFVTLRGIANNIKYMCRKLNQPDYWKSVVVTIVADGRERMSQSTLEALNSMGIISLPDMSSAAKSHKAMGLHLFEAVASFDDERDSVGFPPVQLTVAIKEQNSGKIHSE